MGHNKMGSPFFVKCIIYVIEVIIDYKKDEKPAYYS